MHRRTILHLLTAVLLAAPVTGAALPVRAGELAICPFEADATPPLGSPLCNGGIMPAKEIVDSLSSRGIVLLGQGQPIVLCAFDWVGIGNAGHDEYRKVLARAAGTTPDRVALHCLHQHDAPACDYSTEGLLAAAGLSGEMFHPEFSRAAIEQTARAIRESLKHPRKVTHLGLGTGRVEQVASSRRVLGEDGRVAIVRYSSTTSKAAQEAPEGTIDPDVRLVSFWNGDEPVASLTYYATHPQSYYGKGGVSADFVGLARRLRERDVKQASHIHFNGAAGNVTAGKYNDGSPGMRGVLADRLAAGMQRAWDNQQKTPIAAEDVAWQVVPVALPVRDTLQEDALKARLGNEAVPLKQRLRAARDLAFVRRMQAGHQIPLTCLSLGKARLLGMPGELFVEYQLAAQQMRPDLFVTMAAYGDYGPGYIGTEIAYSQGGYETGKVSRVAPEVEQVLLNGLKQLLQK